MNKLFNKLKYKMFSHLPEKVKLHLIRKNVNVPNSPESIVVKLAETKEELERAYFLLHDAYVKENLMDSHHSALRYNIWSALPYTSVIIVKVDEIIVGTLSLIMDSQIGLPSDTAFKGEVDNERAFGKRVIEVSSFAIDPAYRDSGHTYSLFLMKYLYQYSRNILKADILCASVKKNALSFYKGLFLFEQKGKVISYNFVKGTSAVHISLPLTEKKRKDLQDVFLKYPSKCNLYDFFTTPEPKHRFIFPDSSKSFVLNPIMTPELMCYFLIQKVKLHKELNQHELSLIQSAYESIFDCKIILPNLNPANKNLQRHFRHLVDITAVYVTESISIFGKLNDISSEGAYFSSTVKLPLNQSGYLCFMLGSKKIKINSNIIWKNDGQNKRYPAGIGLKFNDYISLKTDLKMAAGATDSKIA